MGMNKTKIMNINIRTKLNIKKLTLTRGTNSNKWHDTGQTRGHFFLN